MKYLFVICFVLLATLTWAQEPLPSVPKQEASQEIPQEIPQETPQETPKGASRLQAFGDRFHLETTERLVDLSERLDSFFPNPNNRRFDYRRTRLQAKLGLQVDSKGDVVLLQRLNGRIVLPRMEERLSLFFSGAGQDPNGTFDDDVDPFFIPGIEDTHFRFGLNTALRFVFSASDYYLVQNQLGVRLLPTWDPYDELSAQLRIPLGKKFLWQPGQILFWRESTGFGETTRYDLDYALTPNAIVRLHQQATRSEKSNGLEHLHSLSFLRQLKNERGYAIVLEAQGETSPIQRMTQYLLVFTWKQLSYEDWLYVETGCKLLFAHEDSFDPVPALFFSLTADFDGRKSTPSRRLREETPPEPR